MNKPCIACGGMLPLSSFYAHPRMADGHLNRCKVCQRAAIKKARSANPEHYLAYDRARGDLPHRKDALRPRTAHETGNRSGAGNAAWIARNPEKRAAHIAVGNALRDGRLFKPNRCENCNSSDHIQAHHDDYSQPLVVRWLCRDCHTSLHQQERSLPRLGLHVLVLAARKSLNHED